MPVEATPLFRPEVIRPHISGFQLPDAAADDWGRLAAWVGLFETPAGLDQKETELLPDFLTDVFQRILGYRGSVERVEGAYTISREALIEYDGNYADAALGKFQAEQKEIVVAVEGKGPKDPLNRPYGGRRMSAVDQAYRYAINAPCDWLIVTNMKEIRLYHKGAPQQTFERFLLRDIAEDEDAFRRFVFILGSDRVMPEHGGSHLHDLLTASEQAGERLTQQFYRTYADIRNDLLNSLLDANPDVPPADVLGGAQRLLDRALFIAFAEDRHLLPSDTLSRAYDARNPYNPQPVWENFRGLFRSIDQGNPALDIPQYNGGLFADHPVLDHEMAVPDAACELLKRLGDYYYGTVEHALTDGEGEIVDVEILGHIFEQSIEDLEAIRAEIEGGEEVTRASSKRKREGAFYTPSYVTRYIVSRTLDPTLDEKFERLREEHHAKATGTAPAVLEDPRVYDLEKLNNPQRDALVAFWESWIEELKTVRVVDPACGSGAFLIEVFDQLHVHYQQAVDRLVDLRRGGFAGSFFDPDRTILQNNIYGVDLNSEAIEIARLSIWIKTAQRGKILTDLDHNIRVGNSVIDDPDLDPRAFDWEDEFPEVFEQGGFDAVVGNPPYVRSELLTAIKPYLESRYVTYTGTSDLYVYFYELGVRLLRPSGRMSYIVTNKWLKTAYAKPLRRFFAEQTWVEEILDLGHAREVFPDADVFPCILRVSKPKGHEEPPSAAIACTIPRDLLRIDDLSEQVREFSYSVDRTSLSGSEWTLEPPALLDIFDRMRSQGMPLGEYVGRSPMRGIMTGYNKAFLISQRDRDDLIAEDPGCAGLIRPYLRGKDISRWKPEWAELWMIVMQSSGDYAWPWNDAGENAEQIFQDAYPSLYRHFKDHEKRLRGRSDQGVYWWELRTCAHYDAFDKPKVVWKDISYYSEFAFDDQGTYTNDLCFFVPSDDLWLVAVLNSPLMWSYLWRNTVHGKDEALRLKTIYMEQVPIASPADDIRASATDRVGQLIDMTHDRQKGGLALHDWLEVEFGIEKPGQKLAQPHEMTSDDFVAEVKRRRAGKSKVSSAELQRLRDEYQAAIVPMQEAARRALGIEAEISDLVNTAYGLTPEEVDLVWRTAPPRMPRVARLAADSAEATQPAA